MIFSIVALILSIPIGILANLSTPWFRTIFATRNEARRQKRIEQIKRRLMAINEYSQGAPNRLVALAATRIMIISLLGAFGILFMVMGSYAYSQTVTVGRIFSEVSLGLAALVTIVLTYAFCSFWFFFEDIRTEGRKYQRRVDRYLRQLGTSISQILPSAQPPSNAEQSVQLSVLDSSDAASQTPPLSS
jgi:hypothetical protein